ncbi:MAG: flagellar basal body protein FliL [Candidatus Abyssobacteria bacterium SURF_5]|uniref:Flagellar protein FliL n=1 Tax=Abyssobacteria bacterium (strain SURF_5) TaxID=2093360 RepID=A0A3A4NJH3_ABYX5|nr:MAG: flagellar basal body protein FliL [Candidatus Abyssubacteria bacterium SURF_5]
MAGKEPVEKSKQDDAAEYGARQATFSAKNILILILAVAVSSVIALFTVGNYIAPSIESRRTEQESFALSDGRKSDLENLIFYGIDPIIVNPAESNGERYLKATVSLEADDPEIVAEIDKRLPQIKNQINTILSSKTIEQVQTNEDKERLRREIQSRINGLLATGNINNVYFEEFVYQ